MGVCNYSMFCYLSRYVHSSNAIILMGKRELVALLNLSSCCLVMVELLFLAVLWGCLRFVIVVFPDQTHLLFFLKDHNAVMPVRLEPATSRSRVKHSTTEPLRTYTLFVELAWRLPYKEPNQLI